MKIQTKRKKDKVGHWNVKALRQPELENEGDKECDICICGHPKYMHYFSYITVKGKKIIISSFCKVHGCKEDHYIGEPCNRFKKVKGGNARNGRNSSPVFRQGYPC